MLQGKTVVLGVTGSIAAYKSVEIASRLIKLRCNVIVIMTSNAVNFVNPITFEEITKNKCLVDTFDRNFQFNIKHISVSRLADAVIIAPASANVIGKIANGIADDMLTTTVMACQCVKFLAPAMNTSMYTDSILQENLSKLYDHGYKIIEPIEGNLANGSVGRGKMASTSDIVEEIVYSIAKEKDFTDKNILITAGATREKIDPVRYISNYSSGKMALLIAREFALRGADVTVIAGACNVNPPKVKQYINVETSEQMLEEVKKEYKFADICIFAAAVCDFKFDKVCYSKIKKTSDKINITLESTVDISRYVCENKEKKTYTCGFALETEDLISNARIKMQNKGLDMIIANQFDENNQVFGSDYNKVSIITQNAETDLEKMDKEKLAEYIVTKIRDEITCA